MCMQCTRLAFARRQLSRGCASRATPTWCRGTAKYGQAAPVRSRPPLQRPARVPRAALLAPERRALAACRPLARLRRRLSCACPKVADFPCSRATRHAHEVAHRDVKPDNLLFTDASRTQVRSCGYVHPGACKAHARRMHGACMARAWRVHGACKARARRVHGVRMLTACKHPWRAADQAVRFRLRMLLQPQWPRADTLWHAAVHGS